VIIFTHRDGQKSCIEFRNRDDAMKSSRLKNTFQKILDQAGVEINGGNPWDIQVHNDKFYGRVLGQAELGFGESYMDGWWDCESIDQMICRVVRARLQSVVRRKWATLLQVALATVFNRQKLSRAFIVGTAHYDLGNDLFVNMLDSRMNYSCAYWKDASALEDAQRDKLELICRKLDLRPGMRILDIGCGWGAFGKYAAENYGATVIGLTVSKEQVALGRELCKGLPVEFRLQDYRKIDEPFDRLVSVGMFEHVGYKNHRTFMKVAARCLKGDGLFLLHTIGQNRSVKTSNRWTEKYIFPNSLIPSIGQVGEAMEGVFVMEDWHNFGADYDRTLMAWHSNFERNWDKIRHRFDERFYRMWRFYLLSSAGSFRARSNQLWQIVLSKKGVVGGHNSIRDIRS
jgi:cyclopropane-fatty-acyl-phospholipid synthase